MKHFTFQHKNAHFSAVDSGKGVAIIFLHGFLESQNMWLPLMEQLPKKYRCLALDLPGHGKSDNLGYVHSMEVMAQVVYALTQKCKLRRVILVGHSMGGYVALAFAEKYPEMVKGLVLLNSSARADSEERKKNRDKAIALVKKHHQRYIRQAIPLLFRPKNRTQMRAVVKVIKEEALQTSKQGVVAALEGMKQRPDREVLLHFGAFPCFLIAAKNDPVIPFELSREQGAYSNLRHLYLENGHMSHLEDFSEVKAGLQKFLADIT